MEGMIIIRKKGSQKQPNHLEIITASPNQDKGLNIVLMVGHTKDPTQDQLVSKVSRIERVPNANIDVFLSHH